MVALQSYSASDEVVIWTATQRLIADCMASSGFSYTPIPSEDVSSNRALATRVDELDEAIAATAGYHPEDIDVGPDIRRALDAYNEAGEKNTAAAAEDGQFLIALEGPTGGGGCIKQTYDVLYGGRQSLSQLFATIVAPAVEGIYEQVTTDPTVLTAIEGWSECMSAAGYDYSSPAAARAAFALAPEVTSLETATAVQDSRCRNQVDLLTVQRRAEDRLLRSWLDDHPGVLTALDEARNADVAAAERVLHVDDMATP